MLAMHSNCKKPANFIWHPDLDVRLDLIIDALVSADDLVRRIVLDFVREKAIPVVRARIVERILDVLRWSNAKTCRDAEKSVIDMGETASPTLRSALLNAKSAAFKKQITELLRRIAPNCSPTERNNIELALNISGDKADDAKALKTSCTRRIPIPAPPSYTWTAGRCPHPYMEMCLREVSQ